MKRIVLGISGSISAYKAADIASQLYKRGYDVHAVMTRAATSFITPLTLQALTKNHVYVDVMQEQDPAQIVHVQLPQSADLLLIAPASANIIGKIAGGIADDMLTSMVLAAHDIPLYIAPAMNTYMYQNPAVQQNLETLRARGWQIIEPKASMLACGDVGKGALADVHQILAVVDAALEGTT